MHELLAVCALFFTKTIITYLNVEYRKLHGNRPVNLLQTRMGTIYLFYGKSRSHVQLFGLLIILYSHIVIYCHF